MNDSFSKISSPVPPHSGQGLGRGAQVVQIIKLPDALQTTAKSIRLEGQITQVNQNGTASIDTPEGRIDVKVKGNRPPQVGQRLEVEIPAGRPARQAAIRNAPAIPTPPESAKIRATYDGPVQARPQVSSPAPNASNTPVQIEQPQSTATQNVRPSINTVRAQTPQQTPLPPAIQEAVNQASTANIGQQSRPLTQEAVVRLLAVPPAQAQDIARTSTQNLPEPQANIVNRVNLAANITAQNAQTQNINSLLQTLTPQPLNTAPITRQNILTNNAQTLLQTLQNIVLLQQPVPPTTTQVISSNIVTLQPVTTAPTLPASQTLPPNIATNFLQSQNVQTTIATLIPVPVTFNPTNPSALLQSRISQIDIQIVKIIPPTPVLSAPSAVSNTAIQTPHPIPATTNFIPPLTSINNAASITAQVTGFTAQNLPLVTVKWPGSSLPQSFILQQSTSNLQLGSQIQIIPKAAPIVGQIVPNLLNNVAQNPLLQGFQWPALDELYNTLQRLSPQAAASLGRALPNAGNSSQIGTAAMMFIAAIRSGNLGAWLGDKKMDLLQQTQRSDLLSRLTQEPSATTVRAPAAEQSSSSDWRAVPLPMFWEGEIHKITLYTRHENQSDEQKNKGQGRTRFIFDLSLSRIGDVQLDGLLRDNRLDLVVRTQNAFSLPMQQTMRQAYSGALDQTDLTGELNFQGSTQNWVHVLQAKEQLGVHA
jgi:hypothetical protein